MRAHRVTPTKLLISHMSVIGCYCSTHTPRIPLCTPSPDPSTFSPSPDNVTSPTLGHDQLNSLFGGPSQVGKKKSIARPKHNMRTTSSTFITRLQNVDNLSRNLSSKQGETTFLFYNSSKSFIWTEAGNKAKVSSQVCRCGHTA